VENFDAISAPKKTNLEVERMAQNIILFYFISLSLTRAFIKQTQSAMR
jgi:hypothetical protein